ncbi:MAG: MSCRAMM family protein, partial [Janthinobacterium lividum]
GVPVQPSTTTQPVKFTLTAAPASISGTVLDSGTGAFIAGATVTLTGPSGTVLATTTAKADGTYSFTGIAATTAAANYTVSATAPRYAPGSVVQPLQAGSVYTGINIPLAGIPSGTISGVVTDKSTGLGLVGATVTFTLPGGTTQTTTTKTGGTYTLLNIPTGTYSGIATGPATGQAYVPSDPQTATVTNGGTVTANFALVPVLSGLTGTVTDATTNLPLAGVTITVMTTSGIAVATNPTPITTDANGKFSATLAPGTYVVTAAKASYTSQNSAPTVFALSATVPVSFKLTSSIGTIGGLVTDQNGTGLVSGATVTAIATGQTTGLTFTTSATSTTGPDGSPINYSGQLAVGTYKVTVTKGTRTSATQTITVTGGAFVRADFTAAAGLPALYTFPSGTQFVSTPYDYSSLGFSGLFGALNTAAAGTTPNGNRSNVAVWNPLTGAYALDPNAPADALRLGVGYWVYLKNATPVTVQGATPTAAYVSVALQQGWNQIGVPNPSASGVPISSLLFASGTGSTITFAQAGSSQYNLVTRPLYSYSGGTTYQSLSSTGTLVPWKGYWIYANAAATLEIPTK